MEEEKKIYPDFDEIVFTNRNKEYGAYLLRRRYNRNVTISLVIGISIISTVTISSYLDVRGMQNRHKRSERQVEIRLENLDQTVEQLAPPPPPPPPPADIIRREKYVAPQVLDTIKPQEVHQLLTADQAQTADTARAIAEVTSQDKDLLPKEMAEPEPFLTVEEMPEPPGGMIGLYKYIAENTHYPEMARELNIQGKVYIRFCVTSTGTIDKISVFKGVSPVLDAEALRVVKTFPPFKPGKEAGRAVPVWITVFINFQLN